MPLFESIHSSAVRAGRSTAEFEALLARRLIVHAISCGANKRPRAKAELLRMASGLAGKNLPLKLIASLAGLLPGVADQLLTSAHTRARGL